MALWKVLVQRGKMNQRRRTTWKAAVLKTLMMLVAFLCMHQQMIQMFKVKYMFQACGELTHVHYIVDDGSFMVVMSKVYDDLPDLIKTQVFE